VTGEQMLLEVLPVEPRRVLDLGCGDGRLADLVLAHRASVEEMVAVDVPPPMLELAPSRFAGEPRVGVRTWDLRDSIAPLGEFDAIVSGFAIHHIWRWRGFALLVGDAPG
jgi:spermidine synthase